MSDKNKCKNIILIDRLKKLIDTKTREEIANDLGCDISTITKHYTEDRAVTTEYLVKYARYFHVSADYLLGLSDVATTDKDIQFICDYTGLYETVVDHLHYRKHNDKLEPKYTDCLFEMLNYLLEVDSAIYTIFYNAYLYQDVASRTIPSMADFTEEINSKSIEKTQEMKNAAQALYVSMVELTDHARLVYYDSKEYAAEIVEALFFKNGNILDAYNALSQAYTEQFDDLLF